jgi:hypothetical protein
LIGLRKAQNEASVTDTSIEKKQLAEEPHPVQTPIKKPLTDSLSRLRHKTPSFPGTSTFLENGTFIPKRLADALLAFGKFVTFRDTKQIYLYEDPTESIEPNVRSQ